MRVAVAQMGTRDGDFQATVDAMCAYGERAAAWGADLLVFPSCVLTGYDPAGLVARPGYADDLADALSQLSCRLSVPSLVPFSLSGDARAGREVALVRDGHAMPLRLASWLRASGADALSRLMGGEGPLSSRRDGGGDEHAGASAEEADPLAAALSQASATPVVVEVAGVEVGLALDYPDLDAFADGTTTADVVCYLPPGGYDTDDEATTLAPSLADGCFLEDASDANAWLVAAGAVAGFDDAVCCGGSFVLAPWGELAAVAPSFTPTLLTCEFEVIDEGPLASPCQAPAYDRTAFLWDALALALCEFAGKCGASGLAVALDGSLVSSVAAALAVDAVGPMRVSALVVDEGDPEALADARALARNLRIRDVDEVSARSLETASEALGGVSTDALVAACLCATCREQGLLALSSADKTALAVGEDASAALGSARVDAYAPFGDVYRSDVLALARRRNVVSPAIPLACLRRLDVPRDLGLSRVSDVAERQLSELDAILLMSVERGQGLDYVAQERVDAEVCEAVLDRLVACERSRRQAPLYPIVSARSLFEALVPVTSSWRDHLRDEAAEGEETGGVDGLLRDVATVAATSGGAEGAQDASEGPVDEDQARLADVVEYLSDLAQGGGLRPGGDDLLGGGIFSQN